jgi:hypothetical protein
MMNRRTVRAGKLFLAAARYLSERRLLVSREWLKLSVPQTLEA